MTFTTATMLTIGIPLVLLGFAGCDRLGIGAQERVPEVPSEQALQKIHYMASSNSGPQGRKLYDHPEQARTCGDYELAMRWNRPPNIEAGVFHRKLIYLTNGIPADLPKDSEVLLRGKIERADNLTAGGIVWTLVMADGTRIQAVEASNFLEKQDQAAQESKNAALVKPNKPERAFCGQGVYQGLAGKAPDGGGAGLPLVSLLFAMDRET